MSSRSRPTSEPRLDLFGEVIQEPSFDAAELKVLQSRYEASRAAHTRDIEALAQAASPWACYGAKNGFGWWAIPKPKETEEVTPARLRHVFGATFVPSAATLVVVGNLDEPQLREATTHSLGRWHAAGASPGARGQRATPVGPRIVLVDSPGASQSAVYLTEVAIPANSPDRYAFAVMRQVLGGDSITGRISKNLREAKGYTYGVHARVDWHPPPVGGLFTAGGKVQADKTGASIAALLDEVRKMQTTDVTEEELHQAKMKVGSVVDEFETSANTSAALVNLIHRGLPIDSYATWTARTSTRSRRRKYAAVRTRLFIRTR